MAYIWQERYEKAILESDINKLPAQIAKAKDAINKRLNVLAPRKFPDARAEYEAIDDAMHMLNVLERQRRLFS